MSLDYDWMFDDFWHKISALLGLNMHNVIVLVISFYVGTAKHFLDA